MEISGAGGWGGCDYLRQTPDGWVVVTQCDPGGCCHSKAVKFAPTGSGAPVQLLAFVQCPHLSFNETFHGDRESGCVSFQPNIIFQAQHPLHNFYSPGTGMKVYFLPLS